MAYQDKTIYECCYCGEKANKGNKYCGTCKTQEGRKKVFDENKKIFKEAEEKGLNAPKSFKDWK